MEAYWIEGVYIPKARLARVRKRGLPSPADLEPFARVIYANSPAQARQFADEALEGGEWLEPPKVGRKTETQRMQDIGAPMLPGLEPKPAASKTKRKR